MRETVEKEKKKQKFRRTEREKKGRLDFLW
jgi:hypothetical protein